MTNQMANYSTPVKNGALIYFISKIVNSRICNFII